MPDGNIYAMGRFELCYHCYTAQKVWYNKTWLDKLGLAVPETTEELYQVLKAFKEQDPNGNGKADEVPFSGATTGWHSYVDGFLMNPFVYNDGEDRLVLDNGTVSAAFTTPEWRDGLRYMNRSSARVCSTGSPLSRTGISACRWSRVRRSCSAWGPPVTPECSLNCGRAHQELPRSPSGPWPKGHPSGHLLSSEHRFGVDYRFAITRVAENPVAAFRWVDYMFSEDALLHLYFGEENVDWRYAKPGEIGVDGEPAWFNDGKAAGSGLSGVHTMSQQNQMWGHMGPRYCTWGCIQSRVTDPNDPWYNREAALTTATKAFYDPYKRDLAKIVPPVTIELDEVSEYVELKTTINEFVKEHIALFVTGNLDLDADWDSYLATLDQIGIDRYLELVQSAYDRTYR